MSPIEEKLGWCFRDPALLQMALTHASTGETRNYERLEFLGDRVVSLVIAALLYRNFPEDAEGDLAKRHAALVQGTTIADIAREIGLGAHIHASPAEKIDGSTQSDALLCDVLEALIGALYLEAGFDASAQILDSLWGERLYVMDSPPQDPKTALQEWAQGRALGLPVYTLARRTGPDHAPTFEISVAVNGFPPVTAQGASRRKAEKLAAATLLAALTEDDL